MADMIKKDGGQGQGKGQQNQPQVQRGAQGDQGGALMRTDPMQTLMRDPFQLMRDLMFDPFGMFQASPIRTMGRELVWNPTFEVRETDDAFVFQGDLPGVSIDDIEVSVTGNRLRISGKREHEHEANEGTVHTYERSFGNFMRSFSLPEIADIDKINCDLKDGVLTMMIPKKAGAGQQTKKIQVRSGSKS